MPTTASPTTTPPASSGGLNSLGSSALSGAFDSILGVAMPGMPSTSLLSSSAQAAASSSFGSHSLLDWALMVGGVIIIILGIVWLIVSSDRGSAAIATGARIAAVA